MDDRHRLAVPPNGSSEEGAVVASAMLPLINLTSVEIERIVSAISGGSRNIKEIYPLAPVQEGMLFHHLIANKGDPYLRTSLSSFDNRDDLDCFLRALQAIVDRHDILRTAVIWEGLRGPVQVVCHHASLPVTEIVLDPLTGDAGDQLRAHFDPRRIRLDIRQAPLLAVKIARDTMQERWLLLLLFHHLAYDGVTLELMKAEIQAYLSGRADQLPEPVPFREFVAEARLSIRSSEDEPFFRRLLDGVVGPTTPFGMQETLGDGSDSREARGEIEEDLAWKIKKAARHHGVRTTRLFHLAWAQVLARVSGSQDVIFGTMLSGRSRPRSRGESPIPMMGPAMNTLPVRIEIGDQDVESSLQNIHALLNELQDHKHVSVTLVRRCSIIAAPTPLFSALFNNRRRVNVCNKPVSAEFPGYDAIEGIYGGLTNYPLALSVDDLGEGFGLTVQAQPPIEPMRVCHMMQTALKGLVEALEHAPQMPIRDVEVLPEAERHEVLEQWNDTKAEFPSERCIHELFERQVENSPNAMAVMYEEKQLTYSELNSRANGLAHYLRTLGVKPDERVAICVERSLEMVVGLLGILKAGGAYVPLDPAYPIERLEYMLKDSAPVVLLTQAGLRSRLPNMSPTLPVLELDTPVASWTNQPSINPSRAQVGLTSRHLAYVIYTSGSTGTPKGVAMPHHALCNLLAWHATYPALSSGDNALQYAPLSFDVAFQEIFTTLCSGRCLILVSNEIRQDPVKLLDYVEKWKIKRIFMPFVALQGLAEAGTRRRENAPFLRDIVTAGERLCVTAELRTFITRCPRRRLHNHYGPTETHVVTSFVMPSDAESWSTFPPIGRPIGNIRIYILDEQMKPAPVGVCGELFVGGAGVARGYLNRPELTTERFVMDPFSRRAGDRMYKTGDLGRWLSDGNIEFLGRNDFQVKVRGFRIELGEVEAKLLGHRGVCEAVVVARGDEPGDKRLVAYYVATEAKETTGQPTAANLRDYLSAQLPEYMVPTAYVRLDALPLTPNGKLDRKGLPAPQGDAYVARGYEPPEGEIEKTLARIWTELLKVERVGRHDNFFELGGHSLIATQFVSRLFNEFGVEVPLIYIFHHNTIHSLAMKMKDAIRPNGGITCPDSPGRQVGEI